MSSTELGLDGCTCDERAAEAEVAQPRPGQPAIAYRLATHSGFLQRMRQRLLEKDHGAAGGGAAIRPVDDPAIALLDAFAAVADVLTFYQERIANEGFVRTATERRSLLELARAVGYELSPGVSAGTCLSFTVEDAPGTPGLATVPKGTPVQSLPGQGQMPQTFETSADLQARAEWNAMRPRQTKPQHDFTLLTSETEQPPLYLAGTATNLKAGDMLLFVVPPKAETPTRWATAIVKEVCPEPLDNRTKVTLAGIKPRDFNGAKSDPVKPATDLKDIPHALNKDVGSKLQRLKLTEHQLSTLISMNGWVDRDVVKLVGSLMSTPSFEVYAFRQRLGFFGSNAPAHSGLVTSWTDSKGQAQSIWQADWDDGTHTIWAPTPKDFTTRTWKDVTGVQAHAFLERTVTDIAVGSWAVFSKANDVVNAYRVSATFDVALADYAMSGKATGLVLAPPQNPPQADNKIEQPAFGFRSTTAHVQSVRLELAEAPIAQLISGDDVELDRLVPGLRAGQAVVVSGLEAETRLPRIEVRTISSIEHERGFTRLRFGRPLEVKYDRATVTLNANTAWATHGATIKREVLGSGDATRPSQRFTLKRPSLTHVSAPTARGVSSTLEIRVDDVLWDYVPSLYDQDAHAHCYTVRIDDDGTAAVIFGDGVNGARLPTGQENVVASYRTGLGPDGEVEAGKLSLLPSPPIGIRSVRNPLPALGAAPPETAEQARASATLLTRTLDRVVSMADYGAFARAFAGVGKACAVPLWNGHSRIVHLTIADASGDPLPEGHALCCNLVAALLAAGDPAQGVQVDSYELRFFRVAAGVVIEPRYRTELVLDAARAALLKRFSFERQDFGQPVLAADVLAIIQGTPGVVATFLTELAMSGWDDRAAAVVPAQLEALPARIERDKVLGAQLLLLRDSDVTLTPRHP